MTGGIAGALVGAASGIIGAIGVLLTVRATTRKVNAEARKAHAEAGSITIKSLQQENKRLRDQLSYEANRASDAERARRLYREGTWTLVEQIRTLGHDPGWLPPTPTGEQ